MFLSSLGVFQTFAPRWRGVVYASVTWCAVSFATMTARAETIAPLLPHVTPEKSTEIVSRFHDALAKGLAGRGVVVLESAVVRRSLYAETPRMGCAEGTCALHAQRKLAVNLAATTEIAAEGRNYTVTVSVYRADQVEGTASGKCVVCTLSEALNSVERVAGEAMTAYEKQRALKQPKTVAPIAKPQRDEGTPSANTSSTATMNSLKQDASSQRDGADSGTLANMVERDARFPLWPGLTVAGLSLFAFAGGIPFLIINGEYSDCQGDPLPDGRNCKNIFSTGGPGWGLTIAGITGVVTSTILILLHMNSRERSTAQSVFEPELFKGIRFSVVPRGDGGAWIQSAGRF